MPTDPLHELLSKRLQDLTLQVMDLTGRVIMLEGQLARELGDKPKRHPHGIRFEPINAS